MTPLLLAPTVAPLAVSVCQVCAWVTLEGLELCIACLDIREWSRVNRAFCDVLHRGRPLPRRPGRHPAAEPLGAVA